MFAGIALAAFLVDQLTKEWALKALAEESIEVVGELLTLHLVFNPGAAFGTGTRFTWVFSCLALVAMAVVLWLSRRLGSPLWALGMGLLLGGVAGNFADRLFREPGPMRGHVVDFLMLPNWPVFNVADMCINVAAAVIIIQTFRGVRLDGTREQGREEDAEEAR
jgi:signal peptidase II